MVQKLENAPALKHKFVVKEARFINKRREGDNFRINPKFSRQVLRLSENEYEVGLRVTIQDEQDNPFPFNVFVEISLITQFDDVTKLNEEELKEYLNITCLQILIPYMRSVVTNLTSAALVTPLILPVINVYQFVEGSEFKIIDARKQ